MDFEKHLFISYAHIDNQPLTPEEVGWITRFHAALQVIVEQHLGRKAEIWRDNKLRGNDVFGDEILAQFPKTALFLSVLTPRYVQSEWCTRELGEFCSAAERSGGVVVGNKSRVFKVLKTPVEPWNERPLPQVVQQALGYDFYTIANGTPVEFDPIYGVAFREKFFQKVLALGVDVASSITTLEANGRPGTPGPEARAATVYLAECSYDRRDARDDLKAELQSHGYAVLPDHQLPTEEPDYLAEVNRLVSQCTLSIHLVGAGYGAVPDGPSQKSVVVLQNEVAVARSHTAGLRRLIWLPEGTRSAQAPAQQFIDALAVDAEAQRGADLVTGSFETLKNAMHAALKALEQPATAAPAAAGVDARALVYLICDARDRNATIPLRKYLASQGLEVKTPVFEGSPAEIRKANDGIKHQCDAVIIYYGAGSETWKTLADNEVRRIRGLRRGRPLGRACTYLAAPPTDEKTELLELGEPDLINAMGGFRESEMSGFAGATRR
jgi:hypothetical protein